MSLLIHPGFHKTATTWLQTEMFSDRRLFNPLLDHPEIDVLLVRPHDLLFDPVHARAEIDRLRASGDGARIDVLSSEILTGNPLSGRRDAATLAERLHAAAPDARILFTVRRQAEIVRALYHQYIKRGGTLSAERFFDRRCEPGYFWFEAGLERFDLVVRRYAELFGAESILVLPQEHLARDPDDFLARVVRFGGGGEVPAGVTASRRRVGKGPPAGGTPLFRVANIFRKAPLNPEAMIWGAPFGNLLFSVGYRQKLFSAQYDAALRRAIRERFAGWWGESNARLQPFVPFDLRDYGYELA